MMGTHVTEDYINWLQANENIPLATRLHLGKKVKELADMASALGKQTRLDIKRKDKAVMAMRFFPDGSMEVGFDASAKWSGTPFPQLYPNKKELS